MTKKQFSIWMDKFLKIWEDREPKRLQEVLNPKIEYFETPFDKPLISINSIINLWKEVPNSQKDVKLKYNIIFVDEEFGLAHWSGSLIKTSDNHKYYYDGVFLVWLNEKGLCTRFKQWRYVKE